MLTSCQISTIIHIRIHIFKTDLRKLGIIRLVFKSDVFLREYTLLKIKVLQDAIEEPFCLNDSTKNL